MDSGGRASQVKGRTSRCRPGVLEWSKEASVAGAEGDREEADEDCEAFRTPVQQQQTFGGSLLKVGEVVPPTPALQFRGGGVH